MYLCFHPNVAHLGPVHVPPWLLCREKKLKSFYIKKIPMAKVLMLERSTWSHSTGNFPENFLGSSGGFGDRYKAHLGINLGQKR